MDELMVATYYGLDEALLGDNRIKVEEQARILREQHPNEAFTFEGMVDHEHFTKAVKKSKTLNEIDLIVIGSDGVSGISEAIWSTHSLRIIRNVDCPVLMIPEDYSFQNLERIQYLLDYNDVFDKCGKELLIDMINSYQPEIDALRLNFGYRMVPENFESELEKMRNVFFDCNVDYFAQTGDSPHAFILSHLIGKPAQMQVLSADNSSFLKETFSASHLKLIVDQATIPLLILRNCHDS